MRRTLTIAPLAAAALLIGALGLQTVSAAPSAARATKCNIKGDQRDLGASYVTSLKVRGTSCAKGKGITKAFNNCRFQNGGSNGKCNHKVGAYRCSEHRYAKLTKPYKRRYFAWREVHYHKCQCGHRVVVDVF